MAERSWILGMLLLAACGASPHIDPPRSTGGIGGGTIGTGGASTGGGAQGSNSLDGPLGFTPTGAFGTVDGAAPLRVELTDSNWTCADTDSSRAVKIAIGSADAGPSLGTYAIGSGAAVELWTSISHPLALTAQAVSGQVTLNQLTTSVASGNFAVTLQTEDGGTSDLSGIFTVNRCF